MIKEILSAKKFFQQSRQQYLKKTRIQTKKTYLINILVFDKIWNKNDADVAAAACVILRLKTKNPPKRIYWIRSSIFLYLFTYDCFEPLHYSVKIN